MGDIPREKETEEGKAHEIEPFIEDPAGGKEEPIDVKNIVYLIVLLHGVGVLMPWNMFITIAPAYYSNYKMMNLDDNGTANIKTAYSDNFQSYLGIAAQVPNLLFALINIFIPVKGDLTKRISLSLIIVGAVIVFTMGFIYVDTWSWMGGFFWLTMISVVILNAANGVYQSSVFGLASDFPFKYTSAVIIGNNLSGTFVTILSIFTATLFPQVADAAFVYFAISLVTLAGCFGSFFTLKKKEFFIYHSEKSARERAAEADKAGEVGVRDYIDTFKQGWYMFLNVFLVFFVSLTVFPGMQVGIQSYRANHNDPYDFIIPEKLFISLTCFAVFNVFAFIGSMFVGKYQLFTPKNLWIAVYPRLLFIPFFAFCNFRPMTRTFPVLFKSDYLYILMAILMSLSSGYLSGLSMMYSPRVVDPSKSRIASMIATFFLILGIVLGLAFTIVVAAFIENCGPLQPIEVAL